jgi:hypothetical protein
MKHFSFMLFIAAVIKWRHFSWINCEYELQGMWEKVVVA